MEFIGNKGDEREKILKKEKKILQKKVAGGCTVRAYGYAVRLRRGLLLQGWREKGRRWKIESKPERLPRSGAACHSCR
jgi:hypothetical protein